MAHSVDVHVGQRLRQCRWQAGMTQLRLAEQIGVKFQQIQKYETGANRVSASRMWEIAAALGVPVSYFFEGLEERSADARGRRGDIWADKGAVDLVRAIHAVPEAQRRPLFDLARVLGSAA